MQSAPLERRELVLRNARRQLLEGRLHLARQAGIVAELCRTGADTGSATSLLIKLQDSMRRVEGLCERLFRESLPSEQHPVISS